MVKEFALNAVYTSSKIQMFRTSSAPIKIQKYIAEIITQERVYFFFKIQELQAIVQQAISFGGNLLPILPEIIENG